MSSISVASISSSFSSLSALYSDNKRPDIESIRVLVISINQYILDFMTNVERWHTLKMRCTSKLSMEKQEFFEFSEQSVLSNLYWAIDGIEAAIQAKCPEEKTCRLKNSEGMLQVPALLDEHEVTAGIPNRYLVCCSYFYLSVVKKLQKDELQVALHFLQALAVFPGLIGIEFAPELCESLFPSCILPKQHEMGERLSLEFLAFGKENASEEMRQLARRYKHWLMYYQVLIYKEAPQRRSGNTDISSSGKAQHFMHEISIGNESSKSIEHGHTLRSSSSNYAEVRMLGPREVTTDGITDEAKASTEVPEIQDYRKALKYWDQVPRLQLHSAGTRRNSSIKCLHDMLKESQSDMSSSVEFCSTDFEEESDFEANKEVIECSAGNERVRTENPQPEIFDQKLQDHCSSSGTDFTAITLHQAPQCPQHKQSNEVNKTKDFSEKIFSSIGDFKSSILELRDLQSNYPCEIEDDATQRTFLPHEVQLFDHVASASLQNYMLPPMDHQRNDAKKKLSLFGSRRFNEDYFRWGKDLKSELLETIEKAISSICFSEGLRKCDQDYAVEVIAIYELLNGKTGVKYNILKNVILEQLLTSISTSKEDTVIRASVSILTTIISANESVIEDIKKKGLRLSHLASALKRNVHEAATLIYLIKPSPTEIKTLELLPTLVEVVCTSNIYVSKPESLLLTPHAASLMIIEGLVTAFDYATNNMHLAAISSPRVLCGLLDMARYHNFKELISLATILVKCMQFDGQCRKYLSQFTPVAPLICLLQSNEQRAMFIALEFFHEILCIPRSSAIRLLQRIHQEGSTNILNTLKLCLQQLQPHYQVLAANLLLQLDTLTMAALLATLSGQISWITINMISLKSSKLKLLLYDKHEISSRLDVECDEENSSGKSVFREETVQVLLKAVASEESSSTQLLSSFILSNIGGTFAWTGEPYTVAWLVKKAGLTSSCLQNMIRNFDWLDQSLQDAGVDSWCSKIARSIIEIGKPVFKALGEGLKSKIRRVSRDSLTTIAWLGCEIAKSPNRLRHSACEILLDGVEQFLHPGIELEERLLACLCIYNYASGEGMKKVTHFSEGVRESLRRFSNVTWMAEELHRVAEFYQPNNSRISCVHTQILEASHKGSGAVTALIYYKGLLYSGHSDGSIKVWDVKMQSSILVWDIKEHRKAVTCFSLFEPGESLLSGSADKTIKVWQMVQRKLELIEVIATKEPIQKLDTYGKMIFAITQGHRMKVIDSSRTLKDICRSKKMKCMSIVQGRIYMGCTDSSIQELSVTNNLEREIKAPAKSWRMQTKSINSIVVYKEWLYCASSIVEGSNLKEWRRHCEPQKSIIPGKGTNILAMAVVEDFIYLSCSYSASSLQIWLRGTQQNVGRISAGSKITSLLTANDMVLCGTETGLIKGWIPI